MKLEPFKPLVVKCGGWRSDLTPGFSITEKSAPQRASPKINRW